MDHHFSTCISLQISNSGDFASQSRRDSKKRAEVLLRARVVVLSGVGVTAEEGAERLFLLAPFTSNVQAACTVLDRAEMTT